MRIVFESPMFAAVPFFDAGNFYGRFEDVDAATAADDVVVVVKTIV